MTCVHKVRWSVKRPEDCRFRLSVSHYKDRIVAPEEYSGATIVTPSDDTQILPTKDKTVRSNITVNPAPMESLATSENGTFVPSSGNVGFSEVVVDVEPSLESLSVTENGQYSPDGFDGYSDVTVDVEPNLTSLAVTENGLYLPESGVDGFDRVSVNVPIPTFETEEKTVTENGVYYPSAGVDGISKVTVDVPETVPDLRSLSVTQNGTYTPEAGVDGFDEVNVNVEEQWDGELVPDENDTGFFHCRVINLLSTDTLVIDGYGTGYRWVSTKSNQPTFVYWGAQFGTGAETADAVHSRIWLVPTGDTTVVIGGPAWGADGAVYTGNYSFKGDYMRYKVIHAS